MALITEAEFHRKIKGVSLTAEERRVLREELALPVFTRTKLRLEHRRRIRAKAHEKIYQANSRRL